VKKLAIALLIGATLVSCAKKDAPSTGSSASVDAGAPSAPATAPAGITPERSQPVTSSGSPTPPPAPSLQAPSLVRGIVLETMSASGYTYVRLETFEGEVWAAVNQPKVDKGALLTIVPDIEMEDFESKSLNRKFDRIVFGRVAGTQPGSVPAAGNATTPTAGTAGNAGAPPTPHMTGGADETGIGQIDVAAAPGGRRVAELWSRRQQLDGTNVVTRGRVVKFLPGIMGQNWIHLRDGSGSAQKGDNDITITTDETVAVGEIITMKGLLKIDQDLGAGYTYKVIVSDAKIVR